VLRFTVLGSGSTGNATLVEAWESLGEGRSQVTRLLVDCGLTLRNLTQRLHARGLGLEQLNAVFITHEHSDHLGCLRSLRAKHRLPLITSWGTWQAAQRRWPELAEPDVVAKGSQAVAVGNLELRPFDVPHDATEPLQLTVSDGNRRLGVVTDLGSFNDGVVDALRSSHALVLETNHDEAMLASGPYPYFLRRRIAGDHGHLANAQSAQLLGQCMDLHLQRVVAAHLSQHNNTVELARQTLAGVLGTKPVDVDVADTVNGTPWLTV
jgi:phosphoribosyl 1,2-cyclic phosphodiesterase